MRSVVTIAIKCNPYLIKRVPACYFIKFFDILPLFIDSEDADTNSDLESDIIKKLKQIFSGFDLLNLYITINNYKFPINNLSKKSEFNIFMETLKPKQYIDLKTPYIKEFDSITQVETNIKFTEKEKEKKNNLIYKNFANSIILIKKIISNIKKHIIDYDKLFIMSILSYRIKEKTINNLS